MRNFFFTLALVVSGIVNAQTLPGGFSHVIDVGQYSDWGKGYLTVTDTHFMSISNANNKFWSHFTYKPENGNELYCGDIILAVDGVSAAGWTKEEFYKKVDNRKDIITLKVRTRKSDEGKINDKEVKIRPLYILPDELTPFGNIFASIEGETIVQERKRKLLKETTYEERKDEEFDFFSCSYYDFLLNSNDPLLDMEILKKVDLHTGWERNEKKPDIIFTIARDANENISSTYIPPSSRTVNVGSTTRARYNYFTKQNDYVTTQRTQTIREGGYTQETKTADLYLEIAALDARKLNDKSISYPPVVWKATAKRHILNPNFNLNEELNTYAGWMTFPPFDRIAYCIEDKRIYAPIGVNISTLDPHEVKEVVEGSIAAEAGIQSGDVIIKADIPNGGKWRRKYCKQNVKKNGWSGLDAYKEDERLVTISRNGSKMELWLIPKAIYVYRFPYWIGAK